MGVCCYRRVPIPSTACASYLTVEGGKARAQQGCSIGLCMDSSTCSCRLCSQASCPARTEGTVSLTIYDRGMQESGTVTITSRRNGARLSAGFSTTQDITGFTNPLNIPPIKQEGVSQSRQGNNVRNDGGRGGGGLLNRIIAMLGRHR